MHVYWGSTTKDAHLRPLRKPLAAERDFGQRTIATVVIRQNDESHQLQRAGGPLKRILLEWGRKPTRTITLADDQKNFDALISPLYKYMAETPSRVPLSDWFDTATGAQVGFQARSVVGGVYI